jgi:hypothetical protein
MLGFSFVALSGAFVSGSCKLATLVMVSFKQLVSHVNQLVCYLCVSWLTGVLCTPVLLSIYPLFNHESFRAIKILVWMSKASILNQNGMLLGTKLGNRLPQIFIFKRPKEALLMLPI